MSKFRRIALAFAAVLAMAGIAVAVDATPAAAAYSDCIVGHGCLFQNDGTGSMKDIVFSQHTPMTCYNVTLYPTGGFHSAVSYFGSGYDLYIYHGAGCTSFLADLSFGETYYNSGSAIYSFIIA